MSVSRDFRRAPTVVGAIAVAVAVAACGEQTQTEKAAVTADAPAAPGDAAASPSLSAGESDAPSLESPAATPPRGEAGGPSQGGVGGSSEPTQSGSGGRDDAPRPVPGGNAGQGGALVASNGGTGVAGETNVPSPGGGAAGTTVEGTAGSPNGGTGPEPEPTPTETTPLDWPLINGVQWADTEGNPIQAHGGGVLRVGDDYYWFGENRNPDGTFYAVSAYRSRDLQRWERVNDVLTMNSDPGLDPANIERPKVVYNADTGRYVMWMHWENGMDYGEARAAVASSDSVDGDYTYHGSFRPMQDSGVTDHDKPGYMSRDCSLFVDDDGKGYFISASNENYDLHLYALSDDYLSIESRAALLFDGGHREAPALFKRNGTYFLLTSGATGWDPNQAQYATSNSLTSGWSGLKNVGDGSTFYSQSTYVLPVEGSSGTEYLYLGDRWAGAWDGRVNDSTYVWLPISFSSDTSLSMSWANDVKIDAASGTIAGSVDNFRFVNEASEMVLSVEGPVDENSADLVQQPADAATSTAWRFNYDGAGYFTLTNDDGGKVIDVPDESSDPIALHLWDGNGGDHQAWLLLDLGEGRYHVVNKKSRLYLGVAGGAADPGAAIEQQSESGGDEQVWRIEVAE